ncbi:MAG: TonB-dependent receptor family protein [Bacteroidales bacterium]|nr:TonB-dependent receptor family protein [Bacteroidales bacterium]
MKTPKTVRVLILLLVTLASGIQVFAQNANIKGVVFDGEKNTPLFYVRVSLVENDTSTNEMLTTFTDGEGRFLIGKAPKGDYVLKANLVGYSMLSLPVSIPSDTATVELGNLKMPHQGTSLNEVAVVSDKPIFLIEGEKTLYNVADDPTIQTGTAADALQNAPGVEVDIEGNITLRGVSSVDIWLNGKPSHLSADNLKQFIQQLPANALERIEVITNPSAKYSSKSDDGIINIVTSSNIKKNSFVSFGIYGSSSPNVGPWLSFVWSDKKWSVNLYANFGYVLHKNFSMNTKTRFSDLGDTSSVEQGTGIFRSDNFHGGINFNASYAIDTMSNIGIWLGSWPGGGKSVGGENTSRTEYLGADGLETFDYLGVSSNKNWRAGAYYGIWYDHDFNKEGHQIQTSLGGNFGYSGNTSTYDRRYTPQDYLNKLKNGLSKSNDYSFDGDVDYTIPYHKDGEISLGVAGSFSKETNVTRYDTLMHDGSGLFVMDSLRSNNTNELEGEFDSYVTLEHRFGNFTMKGGLRMQYTHFDFQILNAPEYNVSKDYFCLFPSLHLSYRTKSMHNFKLSYTRRVRNPHASQLTMYRSYGEDGFTMGNSDLRQTFTNSIEAGWTKFFQKFGSVGVTAYFRNSTNEINSLTDVIYDDNFGRIVSFSQPMNSGQSLSTGAELNVTYRLKTFMSIRFYGNVYYTQSKFMFRDRLQRTIPHWNYSFRLNFWAKLWNVLEIFASANYSSPRVTLFTTTKPNYSIDCGVRADFFKRKLSVHIDVSDIFNWNKLASESKSPYYSTSSASKYVSRYISAGITLRFGKMELESKVQQGSGNGAAGPMM